MAITRLRRRGEHYYGDGTPRTAGQRPPRDSRGLRRRVADVPRRRGGGNPDRCRQNASRSRPGLRSATRGRAGPTARPSTRWSRGPCMGGPWRPLSPRRPRLRARPSRIRASASGSIEDSVLHCGRKRARRGSSLTTRRSPCCASVSPSQLSTYLVHPTAIRAPPLSGAPQVILLVVASVEELMGHGFEGVFGVLVQVGRRGRHPRLLVPSHVGPRKRVLHSQKQRRCSTISTRIDYNNLTVAIEVSCSPQRAPVAGDYLHLVVFPLGPSFNVDVYAVQDGAGTDVVGLRCRCYNFAPDGDALWRVARP